MLTERMIVQQMLVQMFNLTLLYDKDVDDCKWQSRFGSHDTNSF